VLVKKLLIFKNVPRSQNKGSMAMWFDHKQVIYTGSHTK